MKRIIVFAGLFLFSIPVFAGDPVSLLPGRPESRYDYTNATVSVSSYSLASIGAVNGYQQLKLWSAASFYYVLDGTTSTATVVSTGFFVSANTNETIETNQAVGITLPQGTAASTVRYIKKAK